MSNGTTEQKTDRTELNLDNNNNKGNVEVETTIKTLWPLIGRKLGGEVLYERLKDYYSMLAGVSGLIAGFVFIVTNTPIEWKYKGYLEFDTRSDIFGGFLIIGLITSLIATLFATALYGLVNMIGPDDELLIAFVNDNEKFVGKPNVLMMASVIIMLFGSGFGIGGLYSTWVFWVYIITTVLLAGGLLMYFSVAGRAVQMKCRQKLHQMDDWLATKKLD